MRFNSARFLATLVSIQSAEGISKVWIEVGVPIENMSSLLCFSGLDLEGVAMVLIQWYNAH